MKEQDVAASGSRGTIPAGSPMHLTCTTQPPAAAGNAAQTYTLVLSANPVSVPQGSTSLLPANLPSNTMFYLSGFGPDEGPVPRGFQVPVNCVALYSTP